jgi:hypothetical protein
LPDLAKDQCGIVRQEQVALQDIEGEQHAFDILDDPASLRIRE